MDRSDPLARKGAALHLHRPESSPEEPAPAGEPINPLRHPLCLTPPAWLPPASDWHAHVPFALFLTELLRPSAVVELGARSGDSYCAFCQAVRELRLDCRCAAIAPEVPADLREHHD